MFNKAGLPYLRKLKPQQTVALGKVSREREEAQAKKEGEEVRDLAQSTHFDAPEVEAFRAHVRATLELGQRERCVCARAARGGARLRDGSRALPRARAAARACMLPGALDMIDRKGDGFVKMRQLSLGLSALCRGDDDEALAYVFDAYDGDGDGRSRAPSSRDCCSERTRGAEARGGSRRVVRQAPRRGARALRRRRGGRRTPLAPAGVVPAAHRTRAPRVSLDEAGTPAACEHRARVAATFVAAGAAAAAAAELAAQFLKSPEYSEGEGSPGGERAEAPNGDVDPS